MTDDRISGSRTQSSTDCVFGVRCKINGTRRFLRGRFRQIFYLAQIISADSPLDTLIPTL